MVNLPNLDGQLFRALRDGLGVSRSDFAATLGISESTVVRKEASGAALGQDFAGVLAPHILTDYEAGLELGLTVEAISRAEQQGLRSYETGVGRIYWRPQVHTWAARFRRFFPASMDSQALHLADLLGFTERDGVAECGMCVVREVDPPRIAFRQCAFCRTALCVADSCGDSFVPDNHDITKAYPFACTTCISRHRLMRLGGSTGFLPGHGNYVTQLRERFAQVQRSPARLAELLNLRDIVSAARDEADARCRAIAAELRAGGQVSATSRLDIHHNLRAAGAEAANDRESLSKLHALIDGSLKSTHTEPEPL